MSFAGITKFKENLDTLTDSEAFKNMDEGQKLNAGLALVKGSLFSTPDLSKVKEVIDTK